MIARGPQDGSASVNRVDDNVEIQVVHEGDTQTIICSEFNALRVLAMLSIVLDKPLSKKAQKEILL